jgi:phosphomannomutase
MIDKNVYIFDIDGTLTPPRQRINKQFASFFVSFCSQNAVFLATGSDYKKVKDQITKDIISKVDGIFTCMGNELWVADQKVYFKNLKIPAEVNLWLSEQLYQSKYPIEKRGNVHFEHRTGMLNFSIVGRDVDKNIRSEYSCWDKDQNERQKIVKNFNKLFRHHNLEACVGGEISIDIQKIGSDKGQIFDYLSFYKTKIFFGDKCSPNGNDYSLYQKCEFKFSVDNWLQTASILKNIT